MAWFKPAPYLGLCCLFFLLDGIQLVAAQDERPVGITSSPLALPPNEYWDGNDGPWSTFGVQVGTPPQTLRVLPATGQIVVWVVLPEGCTASDPQDCGDQRGSLFSINASSTWSDRGVYELPLFDEPLLGYSGNAQYGYDTVTLGRPGDGGPSLTRQNVAGFATKDFYMGQLGLSPRSLNLTSFNDPQPSLLQSARDAGRIPSRSWGYTAGAFRRVPKAFGSLTLGGYDASRFVPNDLTFGFGPENTQDFLVGIQSITTDVSAAPLLSSGIYAPINSLVSQIWLPVAACQAFERAFGLVWDPSTELYLVSDELQANLTERNPTVTFRLGQTLTGASVNITMPYSSFDLTVGAPLVNGSRRYFPLKRAANDTQYMLGRAFLQDAYLIADYERSNFSISQALFPERFTEPRLAAILPPMQATSPQGAEGGGGGGGLSKGAIGGIGGGVGVAVIAVGAVSVWLFYRRRNRRRQAEEESAAAAAAAAAAAPSDATKAELAATDDVQTTIKLAEKNQYSEMEADRDAKPKAELEDKGSRMHELEDEASRTHEMADPAWPPELQGDRSAGKVDMAPDMVHEMPAGDVDRPLARELGQPEASASGSQRRP